jgi:thiamine biosynthesis lipoprotein
MGTFAAMASPCELLLDGADPLRADQLLALARAEALRIEAKFSRYRDDSVVQAINGSGGRPVEVDAETARLLDLAARCHALSGGRFDVTSGVLRRAWRFDGSDRVPSRRQVKALLPLIGWEKLRWEPPVIVLPPDMEIDLGGLGKEYAVDRAAAMLAGVHAEPFLINFGGDLRVSGPRAGGEAWRVAIESPLREDAPELLLELSEGALATSGDARRFLLRRGRRYSHILNPHTGWPVAQAPRSATVAAPTCLEAGMLATFAMLEGRGAESFLAAQGVPHWIRR